MIVGSFGAVGINTKKNDCGCASTSMSSIFSSGDKPTELGLIDGFSPNNKNPEDFLGRKLAGKIYYDGFDWRDAKLDENGHGMPGNGQGHDWTTGVRDQAACGSCYAFGSLASLESRIKLDSRNPDYFVDLSEQHVVSCGTRDYGIYGCCGAYFTSPLKFIKEKEAFSEDCFSYQDSGFFYNHSSCPPDSDVSCSDSDCDGPFEEVKDWFTLRGEKEQIQLALIQYGPLVTSMYVPDVSDYGGFKSYPNGDNTVGDNVFQYTVSGDKSNHMVCIVGYCNDAEIDSGGYWICKNSWGADWGIDKDGNSWDEDGDGIQDHEGGWFRMAYGSCNMGLENAYFVLEGVQLSADIPKTGLVGEEIHFSAEATDGVKPYTYHWDFGDDESKTGKSVSHVYDEPGFYLVTARVNDSRPYGFDTDTIIEEIRIYENPPNIDIKINEIKEIDCIDPDLIMDNQAEWYYEISVKEQSEEEWDSITSNILEGDDVTVNNAHSFGVLEKKVDIKIKLMEKDNTTEGGKDDLADISSVPDPYYEDGDYDDFYDSDRTDLENYTVYKLTYDITSGKKSYTANGTDDGQSSDQNDAELKFEIESNYMPVNSAKIDAPTDGKLFAANEPVVFFGSASGGCSDVYSYEWDFSYDDSIWVDFNVEGKGSPTNHIFDRTMLHRIALRVKDGITEDISKIVLIDISERPHNIQIEFKNDVTPRKFKIIAEDDDKIKYGVDWNSDGDLNDDSDEWDDNKGEYYYPTSDGHNEPSGWFDSKNKPIPSNGQVRIVVEDINGLQNEKEGVKAKSESKNSVKFYDIFLPFYSLIRYLGDFDLKFPFIFSLFY